MLKKTIQYFLISIFTLALAFVASVYLITYHPAPIENAELNCPTDTPVLPPEKPFKVLSWNIQFLAGKNYVFFFDVFDGNGPDARPSKSDIATTKNAMINIIKEEDADFVMLQEVDVDAKRTDYEDQVQSFMKALPQYKCNASAYYWKSDFVPHGKIMGSVGMKLLTMSKYKITKALRYQLAIIPDNIFVQQMAPKRALLVSTIPFSNKKDSFTLINTHFDAFAQQTNTMQKQVQFSMKLLDKLSKQRVSWVFGGDLNLLPSEKMYSMLPDNEKRYFQETTELAPFFDQYQVFPNNKLLEQPDFQKYFTHFPNDPAIKKPDRVIDYLISSKSLREFDSKVRQEKTITLSDHFPVISSYRLID